LLALAEPLPGCTSMRLLLLGSWAATFLGIASMASNVAQNSDETVDRQQPDGTSLQNGSSMTSVVSGWVKSLLLLLPRGLRRKLFPKWMTLWLGRCGSHTGGAGVTAAGGAWAAVVRQFGFRNSSSSNLPRLLERSISSDSGPGLPVSNSSPDFGNVLAPMGGRRV